MDRFARSAPAVGMQYLLTTGRRGPPGIQPRRVSSTLMMKSLPQLFVAINTYKNGTIGRWASGGAAVAAAARRPITLLIKRAHRKRGQEDGHDEEACTALATTRQLSDVSRQTAAGLAAGA